VLSNRRHSKPIANTWYCLLALAVAACSSADSTPPGSASRTGRSAQGNAVPSLGGSGSGGPIAGSGPGSLSNPGGGLLPPAPPSTGVSECRNATVAFVIDGSGSMCEAFGNSNRWQELRTALLDKAMGLIYRVQSFGSFGMYLYDGSIDFQLASMAPAAMPAAGGGMMGMMCAGGAPGLRRSNACPQIVEVKPAKMNAAKIDAMYPATTLGGSTPTDKAMNYVVDQLIKARNGAPPSPDNPQFIILATDGEPNDICTGGMGGDGTAQKAAVVAAVDRAAAAGIGTFVISLATDPALQMHLDDVARHGNPLDPTAHTYSPISSQDLVMTLTKLLGTALNCLF
jgi:hypothetical protein